MRCHRDDCDRCLAERHLAEAVDDGQTIDPEPCPDLVGDRGEGLERQRVERLVLERFDASPGVSSRLGLLARGRCAGRRTRASEEADDRAILGLGERVGEVREDGRRERGLAELDDPPAAAAIVDGVRLECLAERGGIAG